MAKNGPKIQKHKQQSEFKKKLKNKKPLVNSGFFNYTTRYMSRKQGENFEDWESDGILSRMMNRLRDMEQKSLMHNMGENFKPYPGFPPKNKTDFTWPTNVPPDANWASIRLGGTIRVIGHILGNTFYIIFLDKNHRFWKSEKKHT